MRGEFIFRDERNQPAALPSLREWRDLTSIPFARRPPKLVEADALYAKFVLAKPGSFASLQTAVALKGVLNGFFTNPCDQATMQRVNAGGAVMKRLFHALAEFTGDLALPPSPPRDVGLPPAAHAHARFGILWVLANLQVGYSPGALIGGSLAGIDAVLGLGQTAGAMTHRNVFPQHNPYIGFAFQQATPHLQGNGLPATPTGSETFAARLRAEIEKMVKGFVTSLWEDLKRKARFFVQPSWAEFRDIVHTATLYILRFVKQVPAYVAPAYSIANRLGKIFNEFRHKRNRETLLGCFAAATGPISDYIDAIRKDANATMADHGVSAVVTGALTGLSLAAPVVGALADPIVSIILWMANALRRLCEKIKLDDFLQKARGLFDAEPRLGDGPLRFQPAPSGGLVHAPADFNAFFREGYHASPVVPFLTMNTGVCGDLLTKITLTGDPTDMANETAYLAALKYFAQARELSRRYLKNTGFVFGTVNNNDHVQRVIRLALDTCEIRPDNAPTPGDGPRAPLAGTARGTGAPRHRVLRRLGAQMGSPKVF